MDIILLKGNYGEYIYSPEAALKVHGKFNSVYIGARLDDKSKVIIKKLNNRLKDKHNAILRFQAEAFINFKHKNIASTLDFFEQNGDFFIVREYFQGIDLQKLLKNKSLSKKADLKFILKCYIEALNGLSEIHTQNIIHCDIRPANILVEFKPDTEWVDFDFPDVRIIDFGLCRKIGEEQLGKSPFALVYSPPEQVLNFGQLINETSDLYSLGISLYETISGQVPFRHVNPEVMMNLQIVKELQKNARIPNSLYRIIFKATAKYKFPIPPNRYNQTELKNLLKTGQQGRYQNANEFREALEAFLLTKKTENLFDLIKKLF